MPHALRRIGLAVAAALAPAYATGAAIVATGAYQAALERLMPGPERALAGLTPRAAPSRGG